MRSNLKPISDKQKKQPDVCPNVHVYFITKADCSACLKFKSSGEMDKIINYLVNKTTTSTHDMHTIKNDSWVPQEVKDNIAWAPMMIVQIGTDDGNRYGIFNGKISSSGQVTRNNKYEWHKFESAVRWLCDTIPKRYCNDNNICVDSIAYTTNPFYS